MTPLVVAAWLLAGAAQQAVTPPPDLHLVVESQFTYLARVRTTTVESWMSQGRRWNKTGNTVAIRREDLGLRWRIDLQAGTYSEEKIAPPAPPPPPAKEDVHTLGQDYYDPEFDWTATESGETTTIAGRPCRRFVATGDADYAEATVKFWVCEPLAGVRHPVNDIVTGQLRSDSARRMIGDIAAKRGNAWILGIEETQEPAIAPTMIVTASVKTLEAAPAPPGTFDLPSNVKKAGR